ncbi:hypothetical protein JOM56_015036 [Amanita muscaria]
MLVDTPVAYLENEQDVDEMVLEGNHSLPEQSVTVPRKQKFLNIKKVVIVSIMMQSTNQKANTLQSILGIFLHSTGTPQRVINAFACMGICITQTTIQAAVGSLSDNASDGIRELGQTLLAAYAYDNFDIDLKQSVPVLEKSNQTLKHMTSGLLFPLLHGATKEDMACSEYLWRKSRINPANSRKTGGTKTYCDLVQLFTPVDGAASINDDFNTWIFLRDLIKNIEGFEYLHGELENPDLLEAIPVVKTNIIPAYAMDINNSTIDGNMQAVERLMAQGGVGGSDCNGDTVDLSKHVVIIHGDLGTGKCIKSMMHERSLEYRPWERFQFIKFCPGFFHVKMACIDTLWRIFIKPYPARQDETSLIKDVGVIRAKQTGSVISKCEFRRMHQIVQNVGTARRLDIWRVALQKFLPSKSFTTLEDFAKSKPKLDDLKLIAKEIIHQFVSNYDICGARERPEEERDQQFENAILMQQYFLLYEEFTYALNHGDILRLERALILWIPLFKGAGKHMYASAMEEFLVDTHFVCPERLRHIIRYNLLVNPTGKAGKFRGTDWCVELQNYHIKVNYGGHGSNRSVKRMITESALVGTYKLTHETIEQQMLSTRMTTAHAKADMRNTFTALRNSLSQRSSHQFTPGRKSKYSIPDILNKGAELLANKVASTGNDGNDDSEIQPELEDVIEELL